MYNHSRSWDYVRVSKVVCYFNLNTLTSTCVVRRLTHVTYLLTKVVFTLSLGYDRIVIEFNLE